MFSKPNDDGNLDMNNNKIINLEDPKISKTLQIKNMLTKKMKNKILKLKILKSKILCLR